jgi:UDP-N-acetylmuramoyl-tripeptide--D-alanyl-D-alanine ligase
LGRHQAKNAMLVWAVAKELDLDLAQVARALEVITLPPGRGHLVEHGPLTILNDSYNANPASFRSVIDLARSLRAGRRLVFVAGSMLELGADTDRFHHEIAAELVALEPELLVAVGQFAPAVAPWAAPLGARLIVGPDAMAVASALKARLGSNDLVVLKGSRGMALERLIPELFNRVTP